MQDLEKNPLTMRILSAKFNQGINWNAFSYVTYKLLSTALSFMLYRRLTEHDYATWANLNSIIYLVLLWLDCGLRKSIPRFAPEFAKNSRTLTKFIMSLIILQLIVIVAFTPVFYIYAPIVASSLKINSTEIFSKLGPALFITEGIIATMRLIFHSFFWNKSFNLISSALLTTEVVVSTGVILSQWQSAEVLEAVMLTKIATSALIILASIPILYSCLKTQSANKNELINTSLLSKAFLRHSGIMWMNNNIKSLSERNFMMPFLTYTLGASSANLFKIANEGALLLHRSVVKTIGVTDTSLLAHVEASTERESLFPIAFQKLSSKIATLCLPLLGILAMLYLVLLPFHLQDNFVFQAFLIIIFGYLIESLLSPYERVLEVKQQYKALLCAYIPYLIILFAVFSTPLISYIGLLGSLMIIHGVRLVSSMITVYYVCRSYGLPYPGANIFLIMRRVPRLHP